MDLIQSMSRNSDDNLILLGDFEAESGVILKKNREESLSLLQIIAYVLQKIKF